MTTAALQRRTVLGYAIGSLGTGGFATLPGLVLLYYMTDTLGVAPLLAGLAVTLAKVWDVLIDPVIGGHSDRTLARIGSRRGPMVIGALALPVFFIVTFAVPRGAAPLAAGLWVLIAFLLTATAFSLFQVPYIALPAEIAGSYDERTRLLAARVIVLTLAILLFGAGGPELRKLGGDDEALGYLIMAIVAGLVIGAGMFIATRVVPRGQAISVAPPVSIGAHYRSALAVLRRSQPFRALLLTFILQGLATGIMLAGAQYVATWVLDDPGAVTYLFLALIAPALVFAPIWARIARRIGKERGYLIASALYGIAALSLIGLLWAPGVWVYLPVALAGGAYAGMQALPMSMLPDVISHDAVTNGEGHGGAFGGVWTAGETTGMAFGATALTIVLAASGYIESTGTADVVQSASAISGVVLSFSVVPAIVIGLSLLTLRRYRLRRADIEAADATDSVREGESA
jgi:Na+/melibiose symporter-like transporter